MLIWIKKPKISFAFHYIALSKEELLLVPHFNHVSSIEKIGEKIIHHLFQRRKKYETKRPIHPLPYSPMGECKDGATSWRERSQK